MAAVTWKNLNNQAKVEDVLKFLSKADIGSEIFGKEEMIVKDAIFSCMKKFSQNPDIQLRAIQALQDWQVLSPKGITNEELAFRFDTLLQSLATCVERQDIVCAMFEFLAMVADRKAVKERCARTEETELIHLVGHTLEIHQKDKHVQRAGLQLYEAILNNATEKSQKQFAKKIFRAVGENLQKNHDDPAICFSSYSILCTLVDKMGDKLGPWIDRILGMVLTTIAQRFSAELVAKCMLLLEKMATDEESLYVMAAHPRCLLVFTDALGVLDVLHMSACTTALEYLLRILEDETSLQIVLENLKDKQRSPGSFFRELQRDLTAKSERFTQLVAEAGSGVDEQVMQYWLQLLEASTNLLGDVVDANPLEEAEEAEEAALAEAAKAAALAAPTATTTMEVPVPQASTVTSQVAAVALEAKSVPKGDFGSANPLAKAHSAVAQRETAEGIPAAVAQATPVPKMATPTAAATVSATPTAAAATGATEHDAELARSVADEEARVAAALEAITAAEVKAELSKSAADLPHRKRSFVYEEPDPSTEALDTAEGGGASGAGGAGTGGGTKRRDRVVGTPLTSLATAASFVSPAAKPSPAVDATASTAASTKLGQAEGGKSEKHSAAALAAGLKWENLHEQTEIARVMAFLNTADVATDVLMKDALVVKGALFDAMDAFADDPDLQLKCIQLLQDCQILTPKGVTSEELAARFDQLLRCLDAHMANTELLCTLLEFLAMVADRKAVKERCTRTEDGELINQVSKALEMHRAEKLVQRAGLQLYEAILLNASEKSQKVFAKKIFRAVGENLQKNNDDPAICFTSYSILCTLTDKMGEKLAPWIERILGLVLGTITQLFNAELVAKCLLLLEKLAVEHDSLFVMAAHPRCLRVFTDALGILDTRYMSATITALEYLLRILEDETAMSVVMENLNHQQLDQFDYFSALQVELGAKSDKFLDLAAQEGQLDDGAMQYWLQLLEGINNILVEYMTELRREKDEVAQAAASPGPLPTIHEHDGGSDSEGEEESVATYDESVDVLTGSPRKSPLKRGASANAAALTPRTPTSVPAPVPAAVTTGTTTSTNEEHSTVPVEQTAVAAQVETPPEEHSEPSQPISEGMPAQVGAVRMQFATESEDGGKENEAALLAELAAAAAAEKEEAEAHRLILEAEEEMRQAEAAEAQWQAEQATAEAEAQRIAAAEEKEEAARQAEIVAAAAAAAEADLERAAEEAEVQRQAEEAAAAAALAEAEALRMAAEEEEDARQAEIAAAAAAEAELQRMADDAAEERRQAEAAEAQWQEELAAAAAFAAAAQALEQAAAANAAEQERRRAQEQAERERVAAVEVAEKGRVAAAIAAAERKREEQQAEARFKLVKEEAVRKAVADKAEQERVAAVAEAERAAQAQRAREEADQRALAERAETERRLEEERRAQEEAETARLAAVRAAALRKAAEAEAERNRQAEVARQQQAAREAAKALAAQEAAARKEATERREQAERVQRAAAAAEADRVAAELERVRLEEEKVRVERAAEEARLAKIAADRAVARVAAEREAQRERVAQQAAEVAARLAAAEAVKAAAVEKRNARLAAEKVAREEAEARRVQQQIERDERLEAAKAARALAAQQALADALERTRRQEQEAAEEAVARMASARLSEGTPRSPMMAISVSGAIAAEDDVYHMPPPPPPHSPLPSPPPPAPSAGVVPALNRGDSWRSSNVPFHRSSGAKVTHQRSSPALMSQDSAKSAPSSSLPRKVSGRSPTATTPTLTLTAARSSKSSPKPATQPTSTLASRRSSASAEKLLSAAEADKSVPKRSTSPSPVRAAHTPDTSNRSNILSHTPHSTVSGPMTSMTSMDSVALDLATPPGTVASVTARRASLPTTAPLLPTGPVAMSSQNGESSAAQVSFVLSETQRSHSTGRSVSFERARSPLQLHLTRGDSDPQPALEEAELQRRAARTERLGRIQYPQRHRSPLRVARSAEEESATKRQTAIDGVLEAFAQLSVPSTTAISGMSLNTISAQVQRPPTSRSVSPVRSSTTPGSVHASPPPVGGRSLLSTRSGRFLSPPRDGTPTRRSLAELERLYNEAVAAAHRPLMQRCGDNLSLLFRRLKENTATSTSKAAGDAVMSLPMVKNCVKKLGLVEGRAFHMNDAEILLSRLGVKSLTLFGFALALTLCAERSLCAVEGERNSASSRAVTEVSSYLTVVEFLNTRMLDVFSHMDAEHVRKSAFNPLDEYKEIAPEEQVEVMALLEREKRVFYTIYEAYLPGTKRAFSDAKSALTAGPLSGGLPFSGVVTFSRDFELSPELLSRPQLLEIFNSILVAEKELMQSAEGGESAQAVRDSKSSKPSTLAESISFPQFLDFILMVALRCPMFRGTSSAVAKLSNLLLLLNQSKGKHKIDDKFRWKELVVFKVNPVFAVAANFQQAQGSSQGSPSPVQNQIGSANGKRVPLSPTRGSIPITPAARTFKPTTVPYYDEETQSVVQIRRKTPMSELRNKLSTGRPL